MPTKTVDLNRLKDAVGFKFSFHRWGNRRKADVSKIETAADKDRISMSKSLVKSEEYDKICSYEGELRKWIKLRTMPSFFAESVYLVNVNAYEDITKKMKEASQEYKDLAEKFIAVYPERVKAARGELKDQFEANDYPDVNGLRAEFYIESYWVSFSAPDNLPAEFRQAEADKLEKRMQDAGDCIMQALRAGFLQLVTKASDTMIVKPGDKPKKFYDSAIGNIMEFIDTFQQRNLTNDVELASLIAKAKEIVTADNVQEIRKSADVRNAIGAQFEAIAKSMDGMVEIKKTRRFNFEDEPDPTPAPTPEPMPDVNPVFESNTAPATSDELLSTAQ